MFENIRKNFQVRSARRKYETQRLEYQAKEYEHAAKILDSIESVNNMVVDTDLENGWFMHGFSSTVMNEQEHDTLLQSAFTMYHNNPYARAIVRTLVKFVVGKGPRITSKEENAKTKEKMEDFNEEFRKENKFNLREKELATRLFRDGEFFMRKFKGDESGKLKVRFIRPQLIANPKNKTQLPPNTSFGITTDGDDIETPLWYWKCDSNGDFVEKIPAEEIIHYKIFADSDQKRGISILRIAARRLKQYEGWLDDRIILNKVRSAIALIRKVEGNAGNVKSIRDQNFSSRFSADRNKLMAPNAGTIITTSKGVDYEMISPNINAADVKDDGRAMLLSIAAGIGFPEMIFTSDFANANYASSLVAMNPFIREIEDWQDYFASIYTDLWEAVMRAKIDAGKLGENVNLDCEVAFPPMIQADLDKMSKAFEVLYKYRIVSRKTWRGKMGLDDMQEKQYIEEEDGEDGGVNPFQVPAGSMNPTNQQPGQQQPGKQQQPGGKLNMPMSPINQYGAQLQEALRDMDYETANSICDKIIELSAELED